MILLGEAIQRVQSLYSRGVQSSDSRLTARHIYHALLTARSTILKQQYNKNQKPSQWAYQVLPCVELTKAPVHECPCIPNNGCTILRTKEKLPRPVSGIDVMLIKSVTSLDGTINFDLTSFENEKYSKGNKYTSKKPAYYPRNGYLYFTGVKMLKMATIEGLFDDPVEVKLFPSVCGPCEDCDCMSVFDMEFPVDSDLMNGILSLANDELVAIMKQMTEDRANHGADDTGTTGAMIHQPPSNR